MSHFVVMVVGDNVDDQLMPYMENCCGEPPREYMEFYDTEDEYLEKYNHDSQEFVVMPDGRLLLPWDKEFADGQMFGKCEAPAHLERKLIPFKNRFDSFEAFVKEWYGHDERDPDRNRYGYWQNPDAKWDWYVVGGRWTGYFKLKPGLADTATDASLGRPGVFDNEPTHDADTALKKDIDWDGMMAAERVEANKRYDKFEAATKGITPPEWTWRELLEQMGHDKIDTARDIYSSHPFNKALQDAGIYLFGSCAVETFCINSGGRDAYVEKAAKASCVPYAMLMDGNWYEQGQMGWFGIGIGEKDTDDWQSQFWSILDEVSDDTRLTIVDCHI